MSMEKLPNQITIIRFLFTVIYFGILVALQSDPFEGWRVTMLNFAFIIFAFCAGTDWLDGYVARKYNAISTFGRIADPMVDKILICGSFVFLTSLQESSIFILPWMAVLVLAREFMIDGIRGFIESQGVPFPSLWGGKLKMGLQCVTIGVILLYGAHLRDIHSIQRVSYYLTHLLVWGTIAITIYSAYEYLQKAQKILAGLDEKTSTSS